MKTYQLLTFSKRKHPCKFKFQTLTIIISSEKWEAQISSWGSREISTYIFSMVKAVLTQKWYLLNIYPFSDTRQAYHINDHSSFNPFRQGWLLLYTGRTLGVKQVAWVTSGWERDHKDLLKNVPVGLGRWLSPLSAYHANRPRLQIPSKHIKSRLKPLYWREWQTDSWS